MQLFTEQKKQADLEIVYDLYPAVEELYLPMAYIVIKGKDGELTHIHQKATPETVRPLGLPVGPVHERLFQIIPT